MNQTKEQLSDLLEIALGALADIGHSDDMTLVIARKKAKRIYNEIRAKFKEPEVA